MSPDRGVVPPQTARRVRRRRSVGGRENPLTELSPVAVGLVVRARRPAVAASRALMRRASESRGSGRTRRAVAGDRAVRRVAAVSRARCR
ncbi:hypothetical protein [Asanoa hainanensis]|uniref:hypothetical protein n=1 Tax=Asanoa hainanensis TaxID=560556 RepID=UPI000B783C1E|nr:hypothetical protein [Asanoa hainanensis]